MCWEISLKRKIRLALFFMVLVASAPFFLKSAAAATYNGYGKTTKQIGWPFPIWTWTWHSWTTVDTSQDTLTVTVAYPYAWTNVWESYFFVIGFVHIEDNQRTYGPLLWTFQNHWGPQDGLYWWSISFPYTNTNTGMIVSVFWYYGGVDIFGGPAAAEVHLQYWLSVGA